MRGFFFLLRLNFLTLFFLLLFATLALRLFDLQVIRHSELASAATLQRLVKSTKEGLRGRIFSSDGYLLAGEEAAFLLGAEPRRIEDKKDFAKRLVDFLLPRGLPLSLFTNLPQPENPEKITPKEKEAIRNAVLAQIEGGRIWLTLAHQLPEWFKIELMAQDLPGLTWEEEPRRFYPEGSLFSHVLGIVGRTSNGLFQGYYGVEGFYHGDLKGRTGERQRESDPLGNPILFGRLSEIPSESGRDLVLTVSRTLQSLLETKLKEGVAKYGAASGSVVLINPQTGQILGLANFPSFALGEKTNDASLFKNQIIAEAYEPGSVLKALTLSAGLDTGEVALGTIYEDNGPVRVGGYVVDNWDKRHHGKINLIQVLQLSNNLGAASVARQLGTKKLREYFLRFGLGQKSGVDLEGEESGIVKNEKDWKEIDLLTASFGQGIAVTPLQLVNAFSAIANGGKLMRPYVVDKIRDRDREIENRPQVLRQVLKPETAEQITGMLTLAVEGGEAKRLVLKNYRIAGKTGTAQIPEGGQYSHSETNATFVGFLPSSRQFVMLVKLERPKTSLYAAETAVPLWMEIAKDLISFYGIAPDK